MGDDASCYNYTNVYVKNFGDALNDYKLYTLFKSFGNICSCKVMTDESGKSLGFGFVTFEDVEAAQSAVDQLNRTQVDDHMISVVKVFEEGNPASELLEGTSGSKTGKLYIGNLHAITDEMMLYELFSGFGKISCIKIMKDESGRSRGYANVSFDDHKAALMAIDNLNGKSINGRQIHVGWTKSKEELKERFQGLNSPRVKSKEELKERCDSPMTESMSRSVQAVNLYIKNLDDIIDEEILCKAFSQFGTVISAKVMKEKDKSGFGFVSLSTLEEATRAVTEMNGRILVSKPLYVALAQRKEDRKAQLTQQYMQRNSGICLPPPAAAAVGPIYQPQMPGGYYMQTLPHQGQGFYAPGMAEIRPNPQWHQAVVCGLNAAAMMQPMSGSPSMRPPRPQLAQNQMCMVNSVASHVTCESPEVRINPVTRPGDNNSNRQMVNFGHSDNTKTRADQKSSQEPLTASMLSEFPPQVQKQMLGERLFPFIHSRYPDLAGKITGMLLELDNSELLHLLESKKSLRAKMEEAVAVLYARKA